jgi:hypothetical protein
MREDFPGLGRIPLAPGAFEGEAVEGFAVWVVGFPVRTDFLKITSYGN